MKDLVKYEFKKIWTQLTIVSLIGLVIITTILSFTWYFSSSRAITNDGKEIDGIKSFRAMKNESKEIEGVMDQSYLDNLVKNFNSSKEKQEFEDLLGFVRTKYDYSNQIINFANYGNETNTSKMGLDFDFVKSEKELYDKYKKSASDAIKINNQKNWFKYTEDQMIKINEKVDNLNTPFKVGYHGGISYFNLTYGMQYWLVFIPIVFGLSSLFSKDSNNGIDELTLSSKFGRKKNMNARIIAGNIFAVIVYAIFIATLIIENGAIHSLHGLSQSAQTYWYTCLYNISLGTGMLIIIGEGLIGVLILANLVMLISIKVKNLKLTTIISLATLWGIVRLTNTNNSLLLQLNPVYFATRLAKGVRDFEMYYPIFNKMIPYSLAFIVLACIYLLIIRFLIVRQYNRYKIN